MTSGLFHPVIAGWFAQRFGQPTEPQRLAWPHIAAGRHTLIAAPTGSGKTLAAFLACIDQLFEKAVDGRLEDATEVVYVSPLKALSNDIRRNLEVPLAEIRAAAEAAGLEAPPIRALVRTGDTPQSERQKMQRRPPHILVTTPESLYLLLTSPRSRAGLSTVRTVIVDEIHALARDKRGSHLALSLERLEALCERPPVRIGLSATQRPIDEIAALLVGSQRVDAAGRPDCQIIDAGHLRELDLQVEVPPSELSAVCSYEQWAEVYERLTELIRTHRSTLVFVNTRRLAERVAHHLGELLGPEAVASHHGSLSREIRQTAEERLKNGELQAIVATASLEMGIDIGFIDLVCQIGSPRSIATLLQRVGRSGHSLGVVPKGRLFPLARDELLECLALVRAVKGGRLDQVEIPAEPIDILAQQIVAAACEEWPEDELYELCRRAWPYRNLSRELFDRVVRMLSEGVAPGSRHGAWLHRDQINRRLRARRGARIAAITSGGAIPETADYRVVTEDDGTYVGTLNEDFAIESLAGDVFLLGNSSWRVCRVRPGEVIVRDAQGAPATLPFWLGEAPGRTVELSAEVSMLREELARRIDVRSAPGAESETIEHQASAKSQAGDGGIATASPPVAAAALDESDAESSVDLSAAVAWLQEECHASVAAAEQAARYVAAQKAALGVVPNQRQIVFERFFDESGGMQLVIHAPLGSRINRAWGLALRKRFCRSFDFELQASADDDGVVLSLGPQHSFQVDALFKMLGRHNAEHLLTQALLAAPMFQTRWRWNATRALAVLRYRGGKKVPPPLQRFRADDLLAAVFPQTVGCLENHHGDIEIPDHPLVAQTVFDCLHEAMDLDRWQELLGQIETGEVELVARDTREPSPFAHKLLNANPYAFLDGAPLEERRARAVATRRGLSIEAVRDLARLDADAIAQVRAEAWPLVRDADELHDALMSLGLISEAEALPWSGWFAELVAAGRAAVVRRPGRPPGWIAAERWPMVQALFADATADPAVNLPGDVRHDWETAAARVELVRGRMQHCGPITAPGLAIALGIDAQSVQAALERLEGEGSVIRGEFTPGDGDSNGPPCRDGQRPTIEWCDRRLLARIHRLTLDGLRRRIQPVSPADYLRFLVRHQRLLPELRWRGRAGLREAIAQLQGFEIPAGAWETTVLPARLEEYDSDWLDVLSFSGELMWGRLRPPRKGEEEGPSSAAMNRAVPVSLLLREDLQWLLPGERRPGPGSARGNARIVLEALAARGALFQHELSAVTQLLPSQVAEALHELAALGLVAADSFAAVRLLVTPPRRGRPARRPQTALRLNGSGGNGAACGRWSLFPGIVEPLGSEERLLRWAWQLLERWGVVFRDLLAREAAAPPWAQLVMVYRRLEARGEIRGGRFVAGVAGEQYAAPKAVEMLRAVRDEPPTGQTLVISAADPLNLIGILVPGARVPAIHTSTLALRNGRFVAAQQAGEIRFEEVLPAGEAAELARRLRRTG